MLIVGDLAEPIFHIGHGMQAIGFGSSQQFLCRIAITYTLNVVTVIELEREAEFRFNLFIRLFAFSNLFLRSSHVIKILFLHKFKLQMERCMDFS